VWGGRIYEGRHNFEEIRVYEMILKYFVRK
jgi:hypothetical protein